MSADHLLVEVGHHLLKYNISGLVRFAEFLQHLQRRRQLVRFTLICSYRHTGNFKSVRLIYIQHRKIPKKREKREKC